MSRYVYLVEVRPVDDAGTEVPQYWSAGQAELAQPYGGIGFVNCLLSGSDDSGPFTFSAEIALDATVGGKSTIGFGALRLDMQFRDAFGLSALALLHWDARPVTIWRVLEGAAWSLTDPPLFVGTTDEPQWGLIDATIPLFDRSRELDVPWQAETYEGTGELEGHEGLKGQRKPLLYGAVRHVEPTALDHEVPSAGGDPYSRVMQVDHGSIQSSSLVVYERALPFSAGAMVAVTDVYAWSPLTGKVAFDAAGGLLRFGTTPVGVVTVECAADEVSDTHVGVLVLAVQRSTTLTPDEFDAPSLDILRALTPGSCGIYVRDERTIAEVCDILTQSMGAAWRFTLGGKFTARKIGFRAPVATITAEDLLEDPRPVPLPPPVWRFRYGWGPVERVLTETDIGDAQIAPAVRERVGQAWRYIDRTDDTTHTTRKLARESQVDGRYYDSSLAAVEADRQFRLLTNHRRQYLVTIWATFGSLAEGDTVTFSYPGFGLDAGADFLIRAIEWRPGFADDEDEATLTLWGPFNGSGDPFRQDARLTA